MLIQNNHMQIDVRQWKRRRHYELYGKANYPYIGAVVHVEVTPLLAHCKENGLKFFNAFLFMALRAMNAIENFRYRIHNSHVMLMERVDCSFTVLDKEEELFYFADADLTPGFAAFNVEAEKAKAQALSEKRLEGARVDIVYVSCLPWLQFTEFIQPLGLSPNDSVPRIGWGKFINAAGRIAVPFSVTANHSLVDGLHIGKLVETLHTYIGNTAAVLA